MGESLFKSLVVAALGSAGSDGEDILLRVSSERKTGQAFLSAEMLLTEP